MAHTSPWDDRYSSPEFIYGTQPNAFLAAQLALGLDGTDREEVLATIAELLLQRRID
jgi:hypothetical protein